MKTKGQMQIKDEKRTLVQLFDRYRHYMVLSGLPDEGYDLLLATGDTS